MSRRENENKKEGPGFLSSLLVAGGAAALGFMAHKLMTDYEAQSARPQASGSYSSSWNSDEQGRIRRKANRMKVHDEDLPNEMRCVVCLENPKEIIIMPCGHVCLCEDCADVLPRKCCPICNGGIQQFKKAYIS